jgi:hypothetical protein
MHEMYIELERLLSHESVSFSIIGRDGREKKFTIMYASKHQKAKWKPINTQNLMKMQFAVEKR